MVVEATEDVLKLFHGRNRDQARVLLELGFASTDEIQAAQGLARELDFDLMAHLVEKGVIRHSQSFDVQRALDRLHRNLLSRLETRDRDLAAKLLELNFTSLDVLNSVMVLDRPIDKDICTILVERGDIDYDTAMSTKLAIDRGISNKLIELGYTTEEVIKSALFHPRKKGEDLCSILVDRGEIKYSQALEAKMAIAKESGRSPQSAVPSASEKARILWGNNTQTITVGTGEYDAPSESPGGTISLDDTGNIKETGEDIFHPDSGIDDFGARARRQVVQEYHRVFTNYPNFSPHAELVFRHINKLGEGGMGVVHKVEDMRLGRAAALKVMRVQRASKAQVKRFMREAKVTAKLDHPSIPPVFEAGTNASGQYYMLMQVISGEELSELIKDYHRRGRTQRQLNEILGVIVRVGEALAYAHKNGIVHRDLKPENIMVGQFGEVMVMDWGISRDVNKHREVLSAAELAELDAAQDEQESRPEAELTRVGAVMGTVGYMPPEQARGEDVDDRADVFAMGAILSKLLTNQYPVDGLGTVERLRNTQAGRIVVPAERRDDIPPELNAIAAAALHPAQEHRMRTAQALTQEIKNYLASYDVSVYNYSFAENLLRKFKRNPMPFIGTFAALIFVALIIEFVRMSNDAERQRNLLNQVKSEKQKADAARTKAVQEAVKAKKAEGEALLSKNEADAARKRAEQYSAKAVKEGNRAKIAATQAKKAAFEAEKASNLAIEANNKANQNLSRLFTERAAIKINEGDILRAEAFLAKSLQLDPRSWAARRSYLKVRLSGVERVWASSRKHRYFTLDVRDPSKTEPRLIAGAGDENYIEIWNADSGQHFSTIPLNFEENNDEKDADKGRQQTITQIRFRPGHFHIAVGTSDGQVALHDLYDGRKISNFVQGNETAILALRFTPDGKSLAVAGTELVTKRGQKPIQRDFVRVWDVINRREIFQVSSFEGDMTGLGMDPKGQSFVVATQKSQIQSRNLLTGEVLRDIKELEHALSWPQFRPDGSEVLALSDDRKLVGLNPASLAAVSSLSLTTLKGLPNSLVFDRNSEAYAITTELGEVLVQSSAEAQSSQFKAHTNAIASIAFVNSSTLMTSSTGGAMSLWDIKSQQRMLESRGHAKEVRAVAFDPKRRYVVSGSADGTIRFWSVKTGAQLRVISLPLTRAKTANAVNCLAFSDDGRYLATGSQDRIVRRYTVKDGKLRAKYLGHNQQITGVCFTPDNKFVVSVCELAGEGSEVGRVWDLKSRDNLISIRGNENVSSVDIDQGGRFMAYAGDSADIHLWSLEAKAEIAVLKGHQAAVTSVSFGPTGQFLASGSLDGSVRIWDSYSAKQVKLLKGHKDGVHAVSFHPKGTFVVSAGEDRFLRFWDLSTGENLLSLSGHEERILSVDFDVSGIELVSGSKDQSVRVWDFSNIRLLGHEQEATDVDFLPDGLTLVSGSNDRSVRIWDAKTSTTTQSLSGRARKVGRLKVSPNGQIIAFANGENSAELWSSDKLKYLGILEGHDNFILDVNFDPKTELIATASMDRSVRLWDLKTQKLLGVFQGHTDSVSAVAFTPDGRLITGSWDGSVKVWDVKTRKLLKSLEGHSDAVTSVAAFGTGDKLLIASGSDDQSICLWDVKKAEKRRLRGHEGAVKRVTFSPEGDVLASASTDSTIFIWNPKDGQALLRLRGHKGAVTGVAFGRKDGELELASSGADKSVRLWNVGRVVPIVRGFYSDDEAVAKEGELLLEKSRTRTGYFVRDLELVPLPQNHLKTVNR